MKKQLLDLSDVYLVPLLNQIGSFVKFIGSGTGLGKTYSAIVALSRYLKKNTKKHVIAIFVAPQHNQISFSGKFVKKLKEQSCSVVKVKPISFYALNDIEFDNNAHDIVTNLFFNSGGQTNQLYSQLFVAAQEVDRLSRRQNVPLASKIKNIKFLKLRIDSLIKKLSSMSASFIDIENQTLESQYEMEDRAIELQNQKSRLADSMLEQAKNITSVLKSIYTSQDFHNVAFSSLSSKQLEKLRTYSAAFYPFLDYQTFAEPHALMGMTVAKLLTKHLVFCPKVTNGRVIWTPKPLDLHQFINDRDENFINALEIIERLECTGNPITTTHCNAAKLFTSEIHLYIDESDDSKATITNIQTKTLNDKGIIQAMGVDTKEFGDIVYKNNYISLTTCIPDNDNKAFKYLNSGDNDDCILRQVGKELIRNIHQTIIQSIMQGDWCKINSNECTSTDELFHSLKRAAISTLSAPYITVDTSIDRNVFEFTSLFGSESFGFIGSKKTKDLRVEIKTNSLCIVRAEFADKLNSIPLSTFFLLITISWFVWRAIYKHPGATRAALMRGQFSHELIDKQTEVLQHLAVTSTNPSSITGVERIKAFINSIQNARGALRGISLPYLLSNQNDNRADGLYALHTEAARNCLEQAKKIVEGFFEGAFSPSNVDIENMLGAGSENFTTILKREIDMHFSYERGQTIHGMVQVTQNIYEIDNANKSHVAFPLYIRKSSAEAFLANLLDTQGNRRICCFCMSATGAFANSHIPAWSIKAINMLTENKNFSVLNMGKEDFDLTFKKQQERGQLKKIAFKNLEKVNSGKLVTSLFNFKDALLQKYDYEPDDSNTNVITRKVHQLKALSSTHKRNEAENIFKAIEFAHCHSDSRPKFVLAMAQTHTKITPLFNEACHHENYSSLGKYKFESLLNSSANDDGVSFGIYSLSTQPPRITKEKQNARKTLVVCYTAGLDKALAKIFKTRYENPKDRNWKLKKLLCMDPRIELKDATDADFSAMNYILNELHDYNVIIISAYQSAARGVNFIVNKKTPFFDSKIRKKPSSKGQQNLDFELNNTEKIENNTQCTERDMDALFITAPPYYSEIRVEYNLGGDPKSAQNRFFYKCQLYLYYIEWKARNRNQNNDILMNVDVDLESPYSDLDSEAYFSQQHIISLLSTLMQALGRIERTNAEQSQTIFYCNGAGDIIVSGIDALTDGHDDKEIEKLTGTMSVINGAITCAVLSGEFDNGMNNRTKKQKDLLDRQTRFESKKSFFLDAIKEYRNCENKTDISILILQQIKFYDAFRSSLIFTKGVSAYLNYLQSIIEPMPRILKRQYQQLINMMYDRYDLPLERYTLLSGREIDLTEEFNRLKDVEHNPFCYQEGGQWLYPNPCFLPDLIGNYGEYQVELALKTILENTKIKRLNHNDSEIARKIMELGDFFLLLNKQLVVIDSKHYRSSGFYVRQSHRDTRMTDSLLCKAYKKLQTIEKMSGFDVVYVIINTNALTLETNTQTLKSLGGGCYSLDSQADKRLIASAITQLLVKGDELNG